MTERPPAAGIQAVLLDIEGTTTPISFVFDVLFPYVRAHLRDHVELHADDPEYARLFDELRDEHGSDRAAGHPLPAWIDAPPGKRRGCVVDYVEWLMDLDRKSTPLKELQGRIWEEGYSRGELIGEVFPDVAPALERWSAQQLQVGIFSSGSARAQRLLFRHSPAGDLTRFLTRYFDTTSGAKTDPASYQRIATDMGVTPGATLFVSDVVRELDAARAAGMLTKLALRPGNLQQPPGHGHPVVRSFDELI